MGKPQRGTGLHVDTNGYSPYVEEQGFPAEGPGLPLEKWFPLQGLVALSDHHATLEDGGLEVVPGFHVVCQKYFQLRERPVNDDGTISGRNLAKWGKYVTKFPQQNCDIIDLVAKVARVPEGWSLDALPHRQEPSEIAALSGKDEILAYLGQISAELRGFGPGEAPQKGDYVLWDNLLPHQSAGSNQTEVIRRVMYQTYLPDQECNHAWIDRQHEWREKKIHPSDFEENWRRAEVEEEFAVLSDFGSLLWRDRGGFELGEEHRQRRWKEIQDRFPLEQRYIDFYKRYGYVVIPRVVSGEMIDRLNRRVDAFLEKKAGISVGDLQATLTAKKWKKVSGTFGGMLNVMYLPEMEEIRADFGCYAVQAQILSQTYAAGNQPLYQTAPLKSFDPTVLYTRIDRLNFRFPQSYSHLFDG